MWFLFAKREAKGECGVEKEEAVREAAENPQQPQMLLIAVLIALCTVWAERGQFHLLLELINWLGTECGNTPRWFYRSTPTTFVDRCKISRLADVKHMLNHRTASGEVAGVEEGKERGNYSI